ncbi:hypothetical protein PT2222_260045 [Paraburkholderia tropica]
MVRNCGESGARGREAECGAAVGPSIRNPYQVVVIRGEPHERGIAWVIAPGMNLSSRANTAA